MKKYLFTKPLQEFKSITQGLYESKTIPCGVAYVAAALRQTGRSISSFTMSYETSVSELIDCIETEQIDVLCVGAMSPEYPALKQMIASVRENCPNVKILVGGGIITAEPEYIVTILDMDFGCIGYGEEFICEFADCLESGGDFNEIKGLIHRGDDGKYIINPSRPEPRCIDDFVYPAYELFGLGSEEGTIGVPIVGSRSCPFNCTFCFHGNSSYKERSLDSIFEEIEYWQQKFQVSHVSLYDELFGYKKERVLEFCERFKKLGVTLYLSLRVDIVTDELMKELSDVGCKIFYGIESANQDVLDSMKKRITVEQIENALRITSKNNITFYGNILFGDTVETTERATETLEWWFRNHHYGFNLYPIRAYPGSILYKRGVESGLIDRDDFYSRGCPVVNLSAMSDFEFEKLMRKVEILAELDGEPVINAKIEEKDGTIRFCGDCSACGAANSVNAEKFYKSVESYFNDVCVHCGAKMKVVNRYKGYIDGTDYFESFDYGDKKIAVWGCTDKAMFRMGMNKNLKKHCVAIVDANFDSLTSPFFGHTVQSPEALLKSDFDVIYIGARFYAARTEIRTRVLEMFGNTKEIMAIS